MIIGHQKQYNFLKKVAENKNFSHAYLFSGSEKLGKRSLALEWISVLLKEDVKNLANHPDLIFIEPQSKEIQISQIRDLIWKFSLKPSLAPIKAAIINNAHLMNQEAQTCLLKTLEEPKGNAVLILISDKAQYLFPTILSRVQTIKFSYVKKEAIKNQLLELKVSEREAEEISKISLGRPGIAFELMADGEKVGKFNQKLEEIKKVSASPLFFRFRYVKSLSENPEEIKGVLDMWTMYFRKKLIESVNNKQSVSRLCKILNFLQKTNFLISTTNINMRLALERLMLEI